MASARTTSEPERLAHVEGLLEEVREEVHALRQDMQRSDDKIDRNFLWTLGIMVTMWVTIILAGLLRT